MKAYLRNNDHFADMINAGIFQGREVIDPKKLEDLNPNLPIIFDSGGKNVLTIERLRDLVRMYDMGDYILILGIENQKTIHHRMASRILMYDVALINSFIIKMAFIDADIVLSIGIILCFFWAYCL